MKAVLAILGPLHLHVNLKINLSTATKKPAMILFGTAMIPDQSRSRENWYLNNTVFQIINIYQALISLSCSSCMSLAHLLSDLSVHI